MSNKESKIIKILFTGGGSGGHIFPIVAIVREIRRLYPQKKFQFFYLGPSDVFASIVLSQEDIKVEILLAGKIRGYFTGQAILQNIADIFFRIPVSFAQAFFHILFLNPDIIFGTGGYGSFSAVVVGRLFQAPIFLHEADSAAGLCNKFLARSAWQIFTSFSQTRDFGKTKVILTGNPIRREILQGTKEEAAKMFELAGRKPLILLLGGSQGAQRLNDMLLSILPDIVKDFEIIHQAGEKNYEEVKREAATLLSQELKKDYHISGFLREQELKQAYAAADLIVSRSGSGAIFEIAALAKPSILVPLPEARKNHQVNNAYLYSDSGAALVIEESNLTARFFLEKLKFLFSHPQELEKMRAGARAFARPEAAQKIAEYIIDYAK